MEITTTRYALVNKVPVVETLYFTKDTDREDLVDLEGERYFWLGGNWLGTPSKELFEKIDPSLPDYYTLTTKGPVEVDPSKFEEAIPNLKLKNEVLTDPFNLKFLEKGVEIISKEQYLETL